MCKKGNPLLLFLAATFHTHAKVVEIMRQNAKSFRFFTLAFCVH